MSACHERASGKPETRSGPAHRGGINLIDGITQISARRVVRMTTCANLRAIRRCDRSRLQSERNRIGWSHRRRQECQIHGAHRLGAGPNAMDGLPFSRFGNVCRELHTARGHMRSTRLSRSLDSFVRCDSRRTARRSKLSCHSVGQFSVLSRDVSAELGVGKRILRPLLPVA